MRTSEKIDQITLALNKAQAKMTGAKKDSVNPFYHSRYADLAEVWEACRTPLAENSLSLIQSVDSLKESLFLGKVPVRNKNGDITGEREAQYIWLSLTSRLMHTSEQWFESIIEMPVEADPQSVGKVTTYLRRYAMMALLGVAPEDDDGEAALGRPKQEAARSSVPPDTATKEHWCSEHNTAFFLRGKMKSFAHPIEGAGSWCYERKLKQSTPEQVAEDMTDLFGPEPGPATEAQPAQAQQPVAPAAGGGSKAPEKAGGQPGEPQPTKPVGNGKRAFANAGELAGAIMQLPANKGKRMGDVLNPLWDRASLILDHPINSWADLKLAEMPTVWDLAQKIAGTAQKQEVVEV